MLVQVLYMLFFVIVYALRIIQSVLHTSALDMDVTQ